MFTRQKICNLSNLLSLQQKFFDATSDFGGVKFGNYVKLIFAII